MYPPPGQPDVLRTTTATVNLPFDREVVRAAVDALTSQAWRTRVVADVPPQLLIQAVAVESADDPDAWLTWTFAQYTAGVTRVTVALDEQADGAPAPELDPLLDRLTSVAAAVVAR